MNQDNLASILIANLEYYGSPWFWRPTGTPFAVLTGSWLENQGINDIKTINDTIIRFPDAKSLEKSKISEPAAIQLAQRNRGYELRDISKFYLKYFNGQIPQNIRESVSDIFVNDWIISELEVYAFELQKMVASPGIIRFINRISGIKAISDQKEFFNEICQNYKANIVNTGIELLAITNCFMINPLCLICPINSGCRFINR